MRKTFHVTHEKLQYGGQIHHILYPTVHTLTLTLVIPLTYVHTFHAILPGYNRPTIQ